jgi:hypothetical protein
MPIRARDPENLMALGYVPIDGAPTFNGMNARTGEPLVWPCAWERTGSLPYVYRVRADDLQLTPLSSDVVDPVTVLERRSDVLALRATGTGGARSLVVAGEVAYPGWRVYLDGERVALESVGGYIGVTLPFSTDDHTILFVYRPRLVVAGLWVTIGTAVLCGVGLALPRRA